MEEPSKMLVPVKREPADMTLTVTKISDNLEDIADKVNEFQSDTNKQVIVDQSQVGAVVGALKELNEERLWLHDKLEEETIKASILRHKLAKYPRDIEGEIRDAVKSAWKSNGALIKSYQDDLAATEESIIKLENEYEQLSVSNITLDPEKRMIQEKRDDAVTVLNQTLADKASLQLKLNETKEKLRETYTRTRDFEDALVEIHSDIRDERQEAEDEEERLKGEVEKMQTKVLEQQAANMERSHTLNDRHQTLSEKNDERRMKKDVIRHYEIEIARQEVDFSTLGQQLEKELHQYDLLSQAISNLRKEHEQQVATLVVSNKNLNAKLEDLTGEVKVAKTEHDKLKNKKIVTSNEFHASKLSGSHDKDACDEMQRQLRITKDELLHQTSEAARLKRENKDLEYQIEKVLQDSIATTEILNNKIQNSQSGLTAERKERQVLTRKRDDLTKAADEYGIAFEQFVMLSMKEINEGKAKHLTLSQQGKDMQLDLKQDEQDIQRFQEQLKNDKAAYLESQTHLTSQVNLLKKSIGELRAEIDHRKSTYNDELPNFQGLEEDFIAKTAEYDVIKKSVVEMKSKKLDLEINVRELKEKIEKMKFPQLKVTSELESLRFDYLDQLREQGEAVSQLELQILDSTTKLKALDKENARFIEANAHFSKEMNEMENRMKEMEEAKGTVDDLIMQYKDWLDQQWIEDRRLDKECHERDVLMLDDILGIQKFASTRGDRVEQIHSGLEDQLQMLSNFVDRVSMKPSSNTGRKETMGTKRNTTKDHDEPPLTSDEGSDMSGSVL